MCAHIADLPDPTTGAPDELCASATDLTLLMHRAANRLRCEFDQVAHSVGLGDSREWLVLTALTDKTLRTQQELGRLLGLDKTTLMALLDRMEQRELIVRTVDPSDRRVRIPKITPSGAAVQKRVERLRDEREATLLADVSAADQQTLRALLAALASR